MLQGLELYLNQLVGKNAFRLKQAAQFPICNDTDTMSAPDRVGTLGS
jgi:hypothetical protein